MKTRRAPKPTKDVGVSVYDFLDYRAYLRAYYEAAKRARPSFSFRFFSKLAGLKSPNFLKLVMDGERNLGAESVARFASALGLAPREAEFFADLVAFNQAENMAEKNRSFERIAASRRFRQARRIDGDLFAYLSRWYNPAVRELAAREDFQEDPRWISAQLLPRITPVEAAEAMKLLLSLGLLVRDPVTARVVRGEPTLTTEHEVRSLGAAAFHRQMLERAAQSLDLVPGNKRDLAALTVCVSAETAAVVKQRIHEFREALTELCDSDTRGAVVYQLNVQWFPLSSFGEEGHREGSK
ncbi:MAG TPA: TIGR02147 family protein [Polyangiaceae bacterium]|nr:TIGR02147 family protein [Polyangiaceae bacterium]